MVFRCIRTKTISRQKKEKQTKTTVILLLNIKNKEKLLTRCWMSVNFSEHWTLFLNFLQKNTITTIIIIATTLVNNLLQMIAKLFNIENITKTTRNKKGGFYKTTYWDRDGKFNTLQWNTQYFLRVFTIECFSHSFIMKYVCYNNLMVTFI